MRRRLSYANVAATLALVFAMSGGALAAGHYLINSTKQINPKVLRALQGKAGPAGEEGLRGKEGPQGKEGIPGKEGAPGKVGTTGAQGKEGPPGPTNLGPLKEYYGKPGEPEEVEVERNKVKVKAWEEISIAGCPASEDAISGGAYIDGEGAPVLEQSNEGFEYEGKRYWVAYSLLATQPHGEEAAVQASVFCADSGSAVQAAQPLSAGQQDTRAESFVKAALQKRR